MPSRDVVVAVARSPVLRPAANGHALAEKAISRVLGALSQGGTPGRPKIAPELRNLIRRMWQANPTWGSPRIVAELHKLGIDVAKSTVEKYKSRGGRLPCATWRTFVDQHLKEPVAIDFFIVPTAAFKVLFVFLVLPHDRRRIIHFNVTEHPTAHLAAKRATRIPQSVRDAAAQIP